MDERMETGRERAGGGLERGLAAGPGLVAGLDAGAGPDAGAAAKACGAAASALDAAIKAALAGGASLAEVEEELERRARSGASAYPRAPLPAGIH